MSRIEINRESCGMRMANWGGEQAAVDDRSINAANMPAFLEAKCSHDRLERMMKATG